MEPGKLRVMEPALALDVPQDQNLVFQVKWDGVRMLTFVQHGGVVLQNKSGKLKTTSFPELHCLGNIPQQPIILDGEVVVISRGKPDISMLLSRNSSRQPQPGAPPITYIIFDILCLQGKDLRSVPLVQRQETLASIDLPPGPLTIIDNFQEGCKLFTLTRERGWEGIVAKDLASPYRPGKSILWKKIKHRRKGIFLAVGYITRQGLLTSILLGRDSPQGIEYVGAVANGLSDKGRKVCQQLLVLLTAEQPPVKASSKAGTIVWTRPKLLVEVEFMEWTDSFALREPVIKRVLLGGEEIVLP